VRIAVLMLGMSAPLTSIANENEWLGDSGYGGYFGLRYGAYKGDAKNYSINTTLPMFWYSKLNWVFSKYSGSFEDEKQTSDQWGMYWNSDPLTTFSFGLGYEENGKGSSVGSKDANIYFQLSASEHWSFRAKYLRGDIELRYDGIADNIEQQFRVLGLLSRQREGFGLSASFDNLYWGVRLSVNYYDYDGDKTPQIEDSQALNELLTGETLTEARFWLSVYYSLLYQAQIDRGVDEQAAIDNVNDFFTRFETAIRERTELWIRQRTQEKRDFNQAYYRYAYGQQNLLSQQDLSIDTYWNNDKATYLIGGLTYESYIDGEYISQFYGGIEYQISERYSVGALVSYEDDYSDVYAELSMGFDW